MKKLYCVSHQLPERHRGLTLVELMVAIVMGLVLLAGVATVFVANKQTYRVQDALARDQENGRFALTVMTRDIRMAGYTGCGTASPVFLADTVCGGDTLPLGLGPAVQGYDGTGSGFLPKYEGADLDVDDLVLSGSISPPPVNDSDIITVRTVGGCDDIVTKHPGTPGNPGSADIQLTSKNCIESGDIVIITDCLNYSRLFVTKAMPTGQGANLIHNTGGGEGNCPSGLTGKQLGKSYVDGQVIKMAIRTYYVGDTGRGVRALYVIDNGRPPQELVEGIESLQVEYGYDMTDDRAVNEYRTATAVGTNVADWDRVRSVRLSALVQSADQGATELTRQVAFNSQTYGGADGRLRVVFDTTATIRNSVQ